MTPTSTPFRPQGPSGSTRHSAGFTLIELLIAVAVIGILAAIAIPNYQRYVEQARRTDAMSALTSIAGQLERCYTVTSDYRYSGSSGATNTICVSTPQLSEEGFYEVDIAASSASYLLTADPDPDGGAIDPNGKQKNDSCGSFTLNHQGVRTPDDCWN
ncbi:type IV pilin protein [Halomonas ventosae]|uniref:type IV pilin protein n=1 Tax=Halomonas ventosae TaxID=229007 RepID=UPI00105B2240|nr:type IV pilin protein [Halomonas ventosae]